MILLNHARNHFLWSLWLNPALFLIKKEDGGGGLVAKTCPTLVTSRTVARQAPLSVGFPRQEYWSVLPLLSPGDLPDPGIKPSLLHCRWILYQLSYKGRCEHVLPVNWSSLWPARVERGLNFHDATPCCSMSLTAAAPNTPYSSPGHIPHSAAATQWPVTCEGGEAGQRGRPTSAHTWYQGIWGQWAVQWG